MATPEIVENDDYLRKYSSKLIVAPIPLLINNSKRINSTCSYSLLEKGNINLVFAGTFIKGVREPEGMLEFIKKLYENAEFKFKLHIYAKLGNYQNLFEEYVRKTNGAIVLHGFVPREEAYTALEQADILVNVGNLVGNQVPSKIFEYMGYCKPILHFYSLENDTCLKYFREYPDVSIMKTIKPKNERVNELIDFITKDRKLINFSDLIDKGILSKCTSKYSSNIIEGIIEVNN